MKVARSGSWAPSLRRSVFKNACVGGQWAPDVTQIFDTPKKCKAHLDSNRGAFLGLQNKCWCFDLQVSQFNSQGQQWPRAGICTLKSHVTSIFIHTATLWGDYLYAAVYVELRIFRSWSSLISKFAIPLTLRFALWFNMELCRACNNQPPYLSPYLLLRLAQNFVILLLR